MYLNRRGQQQKKNINLLVAVSVRHADYLVINLSECHNFIAETQATAINHAEAKNNSTT